MLDRTIVLYGSGMNSGTRGEHSPKNLPTLVAGGSRLGLKHGHHLAFNPDKHPPLSNVLLTLLQKMGVESDRFADATGPCRVGLTVASGSGKTASRRPGGTSVLARGESALTWRRSKLAGLSPGGPGANGERDESQRPALLGEIAPGIRSTPPGDRVWRNRPVRVIWTWAERPRPMRREEIPG